MNRKDAGYILLLLAVCAVRLINLDADPSVLKSTYDVCDEGWWAENARHFILAGSWFPGEYAGGIAVAPLYSLLLSLVFHAGGITLFALRLLPVLASAGTVVLLYAYLARFDRVHARLSALLLALSHAFFMTSRIGHLETTQLFFILLAVYLFTLRKNTFVAGAGLAMAAAILVKYSAVL